MQDLATEPLSAISPRAYALILSSRRLGPRVLPDGLPTSPYEILNYQATLVLHDPRGARTTFQRRQHIQFLQDGVSALLDHAWGDGVLLTSYDNEAGRLEDSFVDEGRRHLVIGLKQAMRRGETLAFRVRRRAMVGFTKDEEWLETTIDHPIRRLSRSIVFPKGRPCRRAELHYGEIQVPLPVIRLASGKTLVRFEMAQPHAHTPYTVRWSW